MPNKNNKIALAIFILVFVGILIILTPSYFKLVLGGWDSKMVDPAIKPQLTPTPTPVEFKFDKNTDLKKELESINPQVLDEDFSVLD